MWETLTGIDEQLLLFLNGMHAPFWDAFMWAFTGKLTWGLMYATVLFVIVRNFRPSVSLCMVVGFVLTIVFADQICATAIRPYVARLRPSNLDNPISEFVHIVHDKRGGRFGFPSCHAANSFAFAVFAALLFRNRVLTVGVLLWAVLNSYTRVYIGVHYPGDLLVGGIIGALGAWLIYGLLRRLFANPSFVSYLRCSDSERDFIVCRHSLVAGVLVVLVEVLTVVGIVVYAAVA